MHFIAWLLSLVSSTSSSSDPNAVNTDAGGHWDPLG